MNCITADILFTKKEASKMFEWFRKIFIDGGRAARINKYLDEIGDTVYKIYYYRHGFCISAISHDLAKAKRKFIENTYMEKQINKAA